MKSINMNKNCTKCTQQFEVTPQDLTFYDKVSPVFGGKKKQIPEPTLCPDCRRQHRLAFRNERKLYHRKCDLCSKEIISTYSTDSPYTVYCLSCWWSDKWDSKQYGADFDFSRPFFDQFNELMKRTPHVALISDHEAVENNCSYINYAGNSKNCFMVFDSDFNEDSYHSNVLKHSKNCIDCSYTQESEKCYECIDCVKCYNTYYSQDCSNCSDSWFLKNCKSCSNCVMCVNLNQKEYHIFNKPYSKEEYFKILNEIKLDKQIQISKSLEQLRQHELKFPHKLNHNLNTENCSGDYIFNSKNCLESYNIADSRDLKYCDSLYRAVDCYDTSSFGEKIEKVYESGTVGLDCYDILFSSIVTLCSSIIYGFANRMSKNCFGCAEVRKEQYQILNKQYSREEYEALVPKIIEHMKKTGEWGQFFPMMISPYGYNETIAQEYYPLLKEQIIKLGASWKEEDLSNRYMGEKVEIPEDINEVKDDLINHILTCDDCGKNYKIIKQELDFHKKNGLPFTHFCPDCRHKKRISKRNPRKLFARTCTKCQTPIQTTYAPDRPEKVYCEKCYLNEVY